MRKVNPNGKRIPKHIIVSYLYDTERAFESSVSLQLYSTLPLDVITHCHDLMLDSCSRRNERTKTSKAEFAAIWLRIIGT